MYKYLRELWKKPKKNMPDIYREKLLTFRREPASLRIDKPTRLDRARSLGYKAKKGFVIIRQRVAKGGRKRTTDRGGRRSKHNRILKIADVSLQREAEQRAQKKHLNCEVLNSYLVAEDGHFKWYEVILIDRACPEIMNDKNIKSILMQKRRVYRGLTKAGRKSRGLMNKGKGTEKIRPSKTQNLKVRFKNLRKR